MRRFILLAILLLPVFAGAQTPSSIIETVREKQAERWDGVDSYAVNQTVLGSPLRIVYRRGSEPGPDGSSRVVFLPEGVGDQATPSTEELVRLLEQSELVGEESIDGRNAFHLRANDVTEMMDMGSGNVTLNHISVWIDSSDYVPLRMSMEGTMTDGAETRPASIVATMSDYRSVPGSKMYESYRQTMTTSSVLTDAERAELEQARAQLAEFESQMASMPESQRQMMENMMGPQINAIREMITDEGIVIDVVVDSIEINP